MADNKLPLTKEEVLERVRSNRLAKTSTDTGVPLRGTIQKFRDTYSSNGSERERTAQSFHGTNVVSQGDARDINGYVKSSVEDDRRLAGGNSSVYQSVGDDRGGAKTRYFSAIASKVKSSFKPFQD